MRSGWLHRSSELIGSQIEWLYAKAELAERGTMTQFREARKGR